MSKPATLRLDRLLANMGYGSRREVQQLARAGLLELDGAIVEDTDQRIAVTPDLSGRMTVDGEPLDPPPGLTLMLNKPLGVTSFVSLLMPLMAASRLRHRRLDESYDPIAELSQRGPVDFCLERVMDVERTLIRAGLSFPFGGSLLVVARR